MANDLFSACLNNEKTANEIFKMTVRKAVEYVRYHFITEEKFLTRIGYPKLAEHKVQHEAFVKELLDQVRDYESGLKFVPNAFARYLRDWVLTHIAITDKQYAVFYAQKAAGGFLVPLD